MAGKIPFILGLGAGYVLGTRAGRAQYERIKTAASKVAEQPFVRTRVDAASSHVKQAVRTQGEAVTEKVADRVVALPFHVHLTTDQIAFIVATMKDASVNVGAGAAIY